MERLATIKGGVATATAATVTVLVARIKAWAKLAASRWEFAIAVVAVAAQIMAEEPVAGTKE